MSALTASRLRELVHYEPQTGAFTWKATRSWRRPVGASAGGKALNGYITLGIDQRRYYAHRLAWLYVHGEWPALMLDHANGNKSDNRIANLREATMGQNVANRGRIKSNTSGFKGVTLHRLSGLWVAQAGPRRLGYFHTPEQAHAAYVEGARAEYGEFARIE